MEGGAFECCRTLLCGWGCFFVVRGISVVLRQMFYSHVYICSQKPARVNFVAPHIPIGYADRVGSCRWGVLSSSSSKLLLGPIDDGGPLVPLGECTTHVDYRSK